jgi:Fe-S cluster assembly protein SufD
MNLMLTRTPAEDALGVTLPSRRDEDWKWTDLRRMISGVYARQTVVADAADVDRLIKSSPFASVKARRIVFVNGAIDPQRSQLHGLIVENQLPTLANDETVVAMNSALAAQGVTLRFEGNADTPVEILYIVTEGPARAVAVRNFIEVVQNASATIIESHLGEGDYLSNSVTEITVGDGARLDRVTVDLESRKATHLAHAIVSLGKNAVLRDTTFTSGSHLNRQNGTYTFNGTGGDARVSGAYLLSGTQHADTKLVIDHKVPHCTSRELFKCVMDDKSRGIFQGKAIVRPDAQKTDGKQSSHALLLSETAEFDAKPELEIYADDVVCGHGATSGDLNHDHMFYLKSRGVPEVQARAMLVQAFVSEAFDAVEHEGVRQALVALVEDRMRAI